MISFFGDNTRNKIFAVESNNTLTKEEVDKLTWVFGEKSIINCNEVNYTFLGPRAAMITPWSTNAVEICQNMGINSLVRIEEFNKVDSDYSDFDYMVYERFEKLDQNIFSIEVEPEKILTIENIEKYNLQEGLSLNSEEIAYLNSISKKIERKLTDSEVFGFSQVNSEHCRHKIFNGKFIIDGKEKVVVALTRLPHTLAGHLGGGHCSVKPVVVGPVNRVFGPTNKTPTPQPSRSGNHRLPKCR